MYGVVLMAALATTSNEPAGCWARHGCCSSTLSCGCSGGHSWGTWCYGCYNGYGSYGGCYATYACYMGGQGYYGHGSHGCYGTCGCYGGYQGCAGGCAGYPGAMPAAPEKVATPPMPAPKPADKKPEADSSATAKRARVVVDLPADAKLYVDDHLMKSVTARRSFHTPELDPGSRYFYDVSVEVLRDGKTVKETRRVVLKAGQEVAVSFVNIAEASTLTADAGK